MRGARRREAPAESPRGTSLPRRHHHTQHPHTLTHAATRTAPPPLRRRRGACRRVRMRMGGRGEGGPEGVAASEVEGGERGGSLEAQHGQPPAAFEHELLEHGRPQPDGPHFDQPAMPHKPASTSSASSGTGVTYRYTYRYRHIQIGKISACGLWRQSRLRGEGATAHLGAGAQACQAIGVDVG